MKNDKSDFERKSRFATLKVLTREIENLVTQLSDTEKLPFLKQTLDMIDPKARYAEVTNSIFDLGQEARAEMNRETVRPVEKQKSSRETMRSLSGDKPRQSEIQFEDRLSQFWDNRVSGIKRSIFIF